MKNNQKTTSGRKQKKNGRAVSWLINTLIVALIVSGLYLLARPRIMNYLQDKKTDQVLHDMEILDQPVVQIKIGRDEFKVEGEELEQLGYQDELPVNRSRAGDPAIADELPAAEIAVNMYATLQIPTIDLTMPVADEASLYALRVSVGHWKQGAKIGEKGNAVIFGHRRHAYGKHFNRLNEVNTGDRLVVTTYDAVYVYQVERQTVITPDVLLQTITQPTDQARLILVTCTPIYTGVDRMLIFSRLVETRPIAR